MHCNLLLIAISCWYVGKVTAFQLGYALNDFAGKFLGCSIVQLGVVSQEASESDRQHIIESFNIFLLSQSKTRYFRRTYQPLFATTLKYSKVPKIGDSHHELEIMGELNNFLAHLKSQMRTHIHLTPALHLVTFFKVPIISCPAPVADALLYEPEVYIKVSGAAIVEPRCSKIDPFLIDYKFDLTSGIGENNDSLEALISKERMLRKRYRRFFCCNLI